MQCTGLIKNFIIPGTYNVTRLSISIFAFTSNQGYVSNFQLSIISRCQNKILVIQTYHFDIPSYPVQSSWNLFSPAGNPRRRISAGSSTIIFIAKYQNWVCHLFIYLSFEKFWWSKHSDVTTFGGTICSLIYKDLLSLLTDIFQKVVLIRAKHYGGLDTSFFIFWRIKISFVF